MDMFRDHQLTVLALTETWHDTDSPVFGRCRSSGYSVADHPHLRTRDDHLSVNHGSVAVAAPGTSLSPLSAGPSSSIFEIVVSYVTTGSSRPAVVVVDPSDSQSVAAQFFDDLSALLERLVVLSAPLFIIGDFNIRLDQDVRHAEQLRSVTEALGLQISRTAPNPS